MKGGGQKKMRTMSNFPSAPADAANAAQHAPSSAITVLITQKNWAWLSGLAGLEARAPLKLGQKMNLGNTTASSLLLPERGLWQPQPTLAFTAYGGCRLQVTTVLLFLNNIRRALPVGVGEGAGGFSLDGRPNGVSK